MKKMTTALLAICLVMILSYASAMTLNPQAAPTSTIDKGTVQYYMSIVDDKQIETNGFLTIGMYIPETFAASSVKKLKAGDTIILNGKKVDIGRISQVEDQEGWFELTPANVDYGYVFLVPSGKNPYYIAIVDDWIPCAFVCEKKVWMPLPNKFIYISGEEETQYTAGEFIRKLQDGEGVWINQYNTLVTLEDGVPVTITHTDYPEGPAE